MGLPTTLYGALHHARESLCIAQVKVPEAAHRGELQSALDVIDRLGTYYCPEWSRFDMPDVEDPFDAD